MEGSARRGGENSWHDLFPESGVDLWLLSLSGDRKPVPFIQTHFNEGNATLSPAERWVTYVSDKSGKVEIYARPFSGRGGFEGLLFRNIGLDDGGSSIAVHWRADGEELFYLSADWTAMSVPVTLGSTPRVDPAQPSSPSRRARGSTSARMDNDSW